MTDDFSRAHRKVFEIMSVNNADCGTLITLLSSNLLLIDIKNNIVKGKLLQSLALLE